MASQILTQDRLRYLFTYDSDIGLFTRNVNINNVKSGTIAGSPSNKGYMRIMADGVRYLSHRLAWLYVYGEFPADQIDHVNGNKADNRLSNLRQATNGENLQNYKNRKGTLGTYYHKQFKRWGAQIGKDYRRIHLGLFDTQAEAHDAYTRAKQEIHEFNPVLRQSLEPLDEIAGL